MAVCLLLLAAGILLAACGEDPLGPEPFQEPLADITGNGHHSCALTVSGKAYCWGRGDNGQLGNGGTRDQFAPVPVRASLRFASIAAGYYHTCALTEAGEAWCWGANRGQEGYGQIGNGSRGGGEEPEPVRTSLRFRQITAGQVHTCALTAAGEAYCWGGNRYGQLGDGTTTDRTRPVAVAGDLSFRHLSAGTDFTCGVTLQGAGYCWGSNFQYTLGTGVPGERCGPSDFACSSVPVAVAGEHSFLGISGGHNHACAWTLAGTAYCWGMNTNGQLGTGDVMESSVPAQVAGELAFVRLELGGAASCGLDTTGQAYCWGANGVGELGNPGTTRDDCRAASCSKLPLRVSGDLTLKVHGAGIAHSCAVDDEGVGYCWGLNFHGQLGVADTEVELCLPIAGDRCSRTPVPIDGQGFAAGRAR